mmetsp:Transcript_14913/g.26130  ORF Transcript_14913/g.26130 Transcript_14913/m.26130 type:complete len:327 (+) Transcript_14913:37-1017(+)
MQVQAFKPATYVPASQTRVFTSQTRVSAGSFTAGAPAYPVYASASPVSTGRVTYTSVNASVPTYAAPPVLTRVAPQETTPQATLGSMSATNGEQKRVAIYGGAFDPVTNSHLTCASEIVHSGCADEVWLVPCGPRPDKPKLKTPAVDRYCMCQIAVNTVFSPEFPVKVSDIDTTRQMAAFTYDLLTDLQAQNPDCSFSFVIGSDWLQPGTNIAEWTSLNHDWKPGMSEDDKFIVTGDKLLQEFEFLVVQRPGYDVPTTAEDPTGLKAFGPKLSWLAMPDKMTFIEGNLSSTEVRKRTAGKSGNMRDIEGLVPPGVLSFIKRGKHYT